MCSPAAQVRTGPGLAGLEVVLSDYSGSPPPSPLPPRPGGSPGQLRPDAAAPHSAVAVRSLSDLLRGEATAMLITKLESRLSHPERCALVAFTQSVVGADLQQRTVVDYSPGGKMFVSRLVADMLVASGQAALVDGSYAPATASGSLLQAPQAVLVPPGPGDGGGPLGRLRRSSQAEAPGDAAAKPRALPPASPGAAAAHSSSSSGGGGGKHTSSSNGVAVSASATNPATAAEGTHI